MGVCSRAKEGDHPSDCDISSGGGEGYGTKSIGVRRRHCATCRTHVIFQREPDVDRVRAIVDADLVVDQCNELHGLRWLDGIESDLGVSKALAH